MNNASYWVKQARKHEHTSANYSYGAQFSTLHLAIARERQHAANAAWMSAIMALIGAGL